jgi:hypothetical protein
MSDAPRAAVAQSATLVERLRERAAMCRREAEARFDGSEDGLDPRITHCEGEAMAYEQAALMVEEARAEAPQSATPDKSEGPALGHGPLGQSVGGDDASKLARDATARTPDARSGASCPDGTDADEPSDRGFVCVHQAEADELRAGYIRMEHARDCLKRQKGMMQAIATKHAAEAREHGMAVAG